ncbi:MAG: ATP-dependent Clp protease adaptor protein ClpS, partial [uncultured Corynebacteriales bacterium]
ERHPGGRYGHRHRDRHAAGHRRGDRRPGGGAVGHPRLERPDQPDVLRHARPAEAVRLRPGEGDQAHARRAPARPRGGQLRLPGADGARRRPAARVRPLGHPAEAV